MLRLILFIFLLRRQWEARIDKSVKVKQQNRTTSAQYLFTNNIQFLKCETFGLGLLVRFLIASRIASTTGCFNDSGFFYFPTESSFLKIFKICKKIIKAKYRTFLRIIQNSQKKYRGNLWTYTEKKNTFKIEQDI